MDNFEFNLISDFSGYNSSRDKTNIKESFLVHGSKNVYKKLSGTIASRFGLKRRGTSDNTQAGVKSSYEWLTSLGKSLPLRVANGKLQVESSLLNGSTYVWYDLMTGLTKTRFVFDSWWDNALKKDRLLFVKGDNNIHLWGGGVTKVASGAGTTIVKYDATTSWLQDGFDNTSFSTIGDTTTQFDITNPSGTTFRYTYDTTGTDPLISATTVPIGSYILIEAQNFNAANNGLFLVTGVGASYFEVTNAAGVAENNKTIGSGFIYKKFTKVVLIGATPYAYTGGEATDTLTGVVPSTSALTASIAVQAIITTPDTPTSSSVQGFTNDFIKVARGGQLHVGSYISRLLYISQLSPISGATGLEYLNFTVPSPRIPGSPEFLTFDDVLKGLGVRGGKVHVFAGNSILYLLTPNQITVNTTLTETTTVDRIDLATLNSAYAHEFIDSRDGDIFYLSQDQQLRTVGNFRNIVQTKYPSLSQAVQSELAGEDFTGGHLRCIGDFVHITAPNNGRDWMYQTRESPDPSGNIIAERLWHPPQIRNISRFAVISGVKYGHSNANPQIYQVENTGQWHDDGPTSDLLPYECVARFAYRHLTTKEGVRRQGKISFYELFTEGYMANGVNLFGMIDYDYQGAHGVVSPVINSVQNSAHFYSGNQAPSLGDASLGDNPFGDGLLTESDDQELLPKFMDIADLTPTDCFEYQITIYSTDPDSRWELLSLGVNAELSEVQAVELRKPA